MRTFKHFRDMIIGTLVLILSVAFISAFSTSPPRYYYFATPHDTMGWQWKIHGWQERQRKEGELIVSSEGSTLNQEFEALIKELRAVTPMLKLEERRDVARTIALWVQERALIYYIEDGAVDYWPTFQELMRTNGDDCDGLDLLALHLLRVIVPRELLFRAIVYRKSDWFHHMVTFWFEDLDDPWVIDPTGASTSDMPRMSELRDWAPAMIFNETSMYVVTPHPEADTP